MRPAIKNSFSRPDVPRRPKTGQVSGAPSGSGYTLIEIAITLLIMSFLFVPAFRIYALWQKDQKNTQTETVVSESVTRLGGFRSNFSRYPCPARIDLPRTDPQYGFEDCTILPVPTADVIIGTLPFRTLNIFENFAFDGEGNRLVYAVTGALTAPDTFAMDEGKIQIIDHDEESRLAAGEFAHFVLLSRGTNAQGAYTASGAQQGACPPIGHPQHTNCAMDDEIFRVAERRENFTDQGAYMTNIGVQLWQLSNANPQNLHLRTSTGVVRMITGLGINDAPDTLIGEGDALHLTVGGESLRSDQAVIARELCDREGTLCFPPERIGGTIGDGPMHGMECPPTAPYLVGISNGEPVCEATVNFSCPPGQFFSGIGASGQLVCNVVPPDPCAPLDIVTTCGETHTLDDGSGGFVGHDSPPLQVHSGRCYNHPGFSLAELNSRIAAGATGGLTAVSVARAYVNELNLAARQPATSCELVRDSYQCDDGTWRWIGTQERMNGFHWWDRVGWGSRLPEGIYRRVNSTVIESGTTPPVSQRQSAYREYDPADLPPEATMHPGASSNPTPGTGWWPEETWWWNSNRNNRDCWCRQDYILNTRGCGGGFDGFQFQIQRTRCPVTYVSNHISTHSSYRENLTEFMRDDCKCVEGPARPARRQCQVHRPLAVPAHLLLSGEVTHDQRYTCPGGADSPPVICLSVGGVCVSPANQEWNVSKCHCAIRSPELQMISCPSSRINNMIYNGNSYPNTAEIRQRTWHCPPPDGPNGFPAPATGVNAGGWSGWQTAHTTDCACPPPRDVYQNCPPHQSAPPPADQAIHYRQPRICHPTDPSQDMWDPNTSNWTLVANHCINCSWQMPAGEPQTVSLTAAQGPPLGGSCTCGQTNSCYQPSGPSSATQWHGCSCE